jgi:excisionase family DNA binding protein
VKILTTRAGKEQLKRFYSVAETAWAFGLSEVTLYRAIHAGQFPAVKIRGRYVIPTKAIEAMAEAAISASATVNASDWANGGAA